MALSYRCASFPCHSSLYISMAIVSWNRVRFSICIDKKMKYFKRMLLWISKTKHPNPSKEWYCCWFTLWFVSPTFSFKKKKRQKNVVKNFTRKSVTVKPKLRTLGVVEKTPPFPIRLRGIVQLAMQIRQIPGGLVASPRFWFGRVPEPSLKRTALENLGILYHFFRQLWLLSGVKLMEINSNWFSR